METKELPVVAEFDSKRQPPSGYERKSWVATPPNVRVTAPAMIMRQLKDVKTALIGLDNMTADFDTTIPVVSPHKDHKDIKISPSEVNVRTEIIRKIEEKKYTLIPINIMVSNSNLKYEISDKKYADVVLSAPSVIFNNFSKDKIHVYAKINNTGEGVHTLNLYCSVADKRVSVIKIEPETIKVTLK